MTIHLNALVCIDVCSSRLPCVEALDTPRRPGLQQEGRASEGTGESGNGWSWIGWPSGVFTFLVYVYVYIV